MTFVLFHGSFNSRNQIVSYWLPKLEKLGEKIIFPNFPVDSWDEVTARGYEGKPKRQTIDKWFQVFNKSLQEIDRENLIFVGHSSGPLFILHVLEKFKIKINSAVFVCPFINPLTKPAWQVKQVNEPFYKQDFDFQQLHTLCPKSYVVYGTDDPYVETENTLNFARKMSSIVVPVQGGKHLNTEETSDKVIEICTLAANPLP